MELLLIIVSIPLLLIIGYIITWIADIMWFGWIDFCLWWAQNLTPRLKLRRSKPSPLIHQVPAQTLPTPTEAKKEEPLPDFDITDPNFLQAFGTWIGEAHEANNHRTDPPRWVRTPPRE